MSKTKIPKIKYRGKVWELWTEIPYWSNYNPRDAVQHAKSRGEKEVVVKKISRYGRVSTQILVNPRPFKSKRRKK